MKLRQGRKVSRNLYVQIGREPDDKNDVPVGQLDSAALLQYLLACVENMLDGKGPTSYCELDGIMRDLVEREQL